MADLVINSGVITPDTIKALNANVGDTLTINGTAVFPENSQNMFKDSPFGTINIEIDTSNVGDMSTMFQNCTHLTTLNLGNNFDTSRVNVMFGMFAGCSSLVTLDLGRKFDTSHVVNMLSMFQGCSKLERLELYDKFDTSKVTGMSDMFKGCDAIKFIEYEKSQHPRFITDGGLNPALRTVMNADITGTQWRYILEHPKKMIVKDGSNIVGHTFTTNTKMIVKYGHLQHPVAHQMTNQTKMIVKENGVIKAVPLLHK